MHDFHNFITGFANFRRERLEDDAAFFETLHQGQSPRTLVIGCCDSRVDPALLTGSRPGDLFVVRSIAALVPPEREASQADAVAAAAEHAVRHLKVAHIIVLGHSHCGGIHGLLHPEVIRDDRHVRGWVRLAAPALERLRADVIGEDAELRARHCEEAAVLVSLENLLSYSWIRQEAEAGQLHLHGWYFDLKAGDLLAYDSGREDFVTLSHPHVF